MMTVKEIEAKVDSICAPIDALHKSMPDALSTPALNLQVLKEHLEAFKKARAELFKELNIIEMKTLLNSFSALLDAGHPIERVFGALDSFTAKSLVFTCPHYNGEKDVIDFAVRDARGEVIHIYEVKQKTKEGDYFYEIAFDGVWEAYLGAGKIRGLYEQLERLDIRFCWIDSLTARTERVEREQKELAEQEKAKGAEADA